MQSTDTQMLLMYGSLYLLHQTWIVTVSFLQRIGEAEEEGKGGQIRATLLSNRATTLVKV